LEAIKQRTQASSLSGWLVFKQSVRQEKLFGLYRGLLSTISRDVPFSLIQMPLWEYSKSWIRKSRDEVKIKAWESCLAGSFAGLIASIVTNPIDVAKTRIMLAERSHKFARINFLFVIKEIYKIEGIRGYVKMAKVT
jgi:S-adenosylmethionine mitochondrial carrier protein